MKKIKQENKKEIFNFKNSYSKLPKGFYEEINPEPVKCPDLIEFNQDLGNFLNIDTKALTGKKGRFLLSGNILPEGAKPIAMAYAGHQFGNFVSQLGDGRAILLGEVIAKNGKRYDIQLKGSGKTSFSRQGDGRAPLGPVIREYLLSEAIHNLNIPSTRSLAIVTSGEFVQRDSLLPGAILTRVASSHIRIGTFEFFFYRNDIKSLKRLADYTIQRHFPLLNTTKRIYSSFLLSVLKLQAKLVSDWMSVGFIHGVMNTDNVSISGETIDYGPCAFMDHYNPNSVFSFIDTHGRYSYGNQGQITLWNLSRLAECLLPLIDEDINKAKKIAVAHLEKFPMIFQELWLKGMKKKLGFTKSFSEDPNLLTSFLELLKLQKVDFTLAFRKLSANINREEFDDEFLHLFKNQNSALSWLKDWKKRILKEKINYLQISKRMKKINPKYIARNHLVEKAIDEAINKNDYSFTRQLLKLLRKPFVGRKNMESFSNPPNSSEVVKNTFCGT